MKKKVFTLLLVCVVALTATAGNGLYIGAGAAYQFVPTFQQGTSCNLAPAAEIGYNGDYFNLGCSGSFNKENSMFSFDMNGRLMLNDYVGFLVGGGYGLVYNKTEFSTPDGDYETSGYMGWPHINLALEANVTNNLGFKLTAALGYGRYSFDRYDYYDYYDHYGYEGWHASSQIRAVLTWTF